MIDAKEPSDLKVLNLQSYAPGKVGSLRTDSELRQRNNTRPPAAHDHGAETPVLQEPGSSAVLERALRDPIIRSAAGVVRESACLLYHIAGLGIALVSGAEITPRQGSNEPVRSAAPKGANVIRFPNSKHPAIGQD